MASFTQLNEKFYATNICYSNILLDLGRFAVYSYIKKKPEQAYDRL